MTEISNIDKALQKLIDVRAKAISEGRGELCNIENCISCKKAEELIEKNYIKCDICNGSCKNNYHHSCSKCETYTIFCKLSCKDKHKKQLHKQKV